MNLRLTALSLMLVLAAGCASPTPQPAMDAGKAASTGAEKSALGLGVSEPALRGALIFECRTPCNVSPGAGCC